MGTTGKSLAVTLSCFLLIFVISNFIVWLLCHAISCDLRVEVALLMLVVFVHNVTYMPV